MSSHRMSSSISMLSSHEITIGYRIGECNQISNNAAYARGTKINKYQKYSHNSYNCKNSFEENMKLSNIINILLFQLDHVLARVLHKNNK